MVSSLVGISGGSLQELGKAKSMLEAYVNGTRKTRPPQKVLDLLEKHQIITKKSGSGRMPRKPPPKLAVEHPEAFEGGKVNRLKKAKKWTGFVKKILLKMELTSPHTDMINMKLLETLMVTQCQKHSPAVHALLPNGFSL